MNSDVKSRFKKEQSDSNPFYTDKAGALWQKLDKNGKPISKDELIIRAKQVKKDINKKD